MATERREERRFELMNGYLMIDGELDPQIAELGAELLRDKEETTWIPEEDPYVACMRIAQDLGRFMVKYAGMDPDDLGVFEYSRLQNVLRSIWDMFLHHENLAQELFSDEQMAKLREMRSWIEMCCNGASPVAAMYWLRMVPRLRLLGETGDWLVDSLHPLNFFPEPGSNSTRGSYILSVEDNCHARHIWSHHMKSLRLAFSLVMPPSIDTSNISIEIWDRDCNVWSDEDLLSDDEALREEMA